MKKNPFLKIIIVIVIPILGVIIPVGLHFYEKKDKNLSFEILSESPIVNIASPLGEKIQVFYSGKKLNNLEAISVRISNSGNIPITISDFEKELQICFFGKNVHILTARVSDAYPKNLSLKSTIRGDGVLISPLLLNPQDYFTIEAFVTGEAPRVELDARIVGIAQATKISFSHIRTYGLSITMLIIALINYIAYIYMSSMFFWASKKKSKVAIIVRSEIMLTVIATCMSSIIILISLMKVLSIDRFTMFLIIIPAFAAIGTIMALLVLYKLISFRNKQIDTLEIDPHK